MKAPHPAIPSIALFMQGTRHYERELLHGISGYVKQHGPWQFYRNVPYLFGEIVDPTQLIRQWKPDALIIRESSPHHYDALLNGSLPVIYSPATECHPKVTNIVVNDLEVGRIAADHLYQVGLRNFAYCGVERFFWSRLRGEGFAEQVDRLGGHCSRFETHEGREFFTWDGSHRHFSSWLLKLPKPIGIFACTDDFALLVQEACLAAGLRIPGEVALVGVGDDESICDLAQVPLSSVQINTRRGGYDAAARLADRLRAPRRRRAMEAVVIEPTVVRARASTDAAESQDAEVAKAIAFIRKRVDSKPSVEEVVGAVNLSRRRLYDRFRKIVGMSLHSYIQQQRLEQFARRILESDLTISEVAYSIGESTDKNIARQFKARYGTTPTAYRQKHR